MGLPSPRVRRRNSLNRSSHRAGQFQSRPPTSGTKTTSTRSVHFVWTGNKETGEKYAARARRANFGCGMTPTPGWENFDNSLSIRLAQVPALVRVATRLGLIDPKRRAFIDFAMSNRIKSADVRKPLPFASESMDVIYASHMVEHLDRPSARYFAEESLRVLAPGGYIRLAVPDLAAKLEEYRVSGDADGFVGSLHMNMDLPRTWQQSVRERLVSFRGHRWMYDEASLTKLLIEAGFTQVHRVAPGETGIPEPGELDLFERVGESLYVEAVKPN